MLLFVVSFSPPCLLLPCRFVGLIHTYIHVVASSRGRFVNGMKGFSIFKVGAFQSLLTACSHRVMDQFKSARDGDLQQLRVALTVDNINNVDAYGVSGGCWTVLHYAAENGSVDCVKFCIEMGANVNARTNGGWAPLHLASLRGDVNVFGVLLDAGAMVDEADNFGQTPLHDAIQYERVNVTQLLMDQGAKLSNVTLDEELPAIPDWVTTFVESRSNCRTVSIAIIGMHKYRRTTVTGNNDVNMIRLIAKHIWSTRMDDVWMTPPIDTKKLRQIQNVANN
jgi:hypothetical protein